MTDRESRLAAMLSRRESFRGTELKTPKTAADYFVIDDRTHNADLVRIFDPESADASTLRWSLMTSETDWSTPSGVKGCALVAA